MPTATAQQTIGPYWHMIEHPEMADLTRFGAEGARLVLMGRVTDGDGLPVSDAAVEIWQADPPASATFPAWGRAATDPEGIFRLRTLRPGPVPGPAGVRGNTQQAPHVALTLHARGLLRPLCTRLYFQGEALNDTDPILALIDEPARRQTLIARPAEPTDGLPTWRLDIRLQGQGETVFMEI
jgi:protocatechuate 3,4-dioxygenase alpha subunit